MRAGAAAGKTRETWRPLLPYVVVYKIVDAAVVIIRLLHGAQLWPD